MAYGVWLESLYPDSTKRMIQQVTNASDLTTILINTLPNTIHSGLNDTKKTSHEKHVSATHPRLICTLAHPQETQHVQ